MIDMIDVDSIQKNEVLVRGSTSNIKTGRTLTGAIYSWHQLERSKNIGFSQVRDRLDGNRTQTDLTHIFYPNDLTALSFDLKTL